MLTLECAFAAHLVSSSTSKFITDGHAQCRCNQTYPCDKCIIRTLGTIIGPGQEILCSHLAGEETVLYEGAIMRVEDGFQLVRRRVRVV